MFSLQELLQYDHIVIQCHNIPDADSIATGYALAQYFRGQGKPVSLVYAGFAEATKPNITEFIRLLDIPLTYLGKGAHDVATLAPEAKNPLLITADCQYGAGNVDKIASPTVCVVDHHLQEKDLPALHVVEPYLGSCATVVWRLLCAAGFDFTQNRQVATALYYGLYTDTNSLSELFHPVDRDMLESLDPDMEIIRWLKNNNLTRAELQVAGNALIETQHQEKISASLFRTEPCDPNILGFISDLTMQAEGVAICVGFNEINDGVKLSVRSATSEVMANDLAAFLTEGFGSGGGNKEKAGGFMRLEGQPDAMAYLQQRLHAYFKSYDVIVAGQYEPDLSTMRLYAKKKVPVGYAVLADIFPLGTQVVVRTLEGDANFRVAEDSYVMIGIQGEAYPIDKAVFEKRYTPLAQPFAFMPEAQDETFYSPTVKDSLYGKTVRLEEHAKACVSSGEERIWAKPLEKQTKVFAKWYAGGYMLGRPGDTLAVREGDTGDAYVIDARVFQLTYEEAP